MDIQITKEEFDECIKHIVDLSHKIQDNWKLREKADCSFITKTSRCDFENEIVTVDYHIVYNLSFATPMLCFDAWKTSGSLLTLEECWKFLNLEQSDKTTVLTQIDHPILLRPTFGLHPCKTSEILQATYQTSKNIVVSWLSSIAPNVKLKVDIIYATLT